ncbi:MAG: RtcB family protein, partial [Chitinophagaceae bacterium]
MAHRITGKELKELGYEQGKILGIARDLSETALQKMTKNEVLALLKKAKSYPELFLSDELLKPLAEAMVQEAAIPPDATIALNETSGRYATYGSDNIEAGARTQMDIAMRLPITAGGALMPDAHQGYGLPIGGVLATRNAIIPYGVGVDIGCRMALTIFDIPAEHLQTHQATYKRELIAQTKFGAGAGFKGRERADHEVLQSDVFSMNPFINNLRDKAYTQLGTSGGGNHFVEWGVIEFEQRDETLNIDKGNYVAVLSHSGSRGLGATIAGYYTKLAKEICKLPKEAANLAWLGLDSEEGNEYWLAMNLAGDYASACHEIIHKKIADAIGGQVLAKVENHHNFAWKEKWN